MVLSLPDTHNLTHPDKPVNLSILILNQKAERALKEMKPIKLYYNGLEEVTE